MTVMEKVTEVYAFPFKLIFYLPMSDTETVSSAGADIAIAELFYVVVSVPVFLFTKQKSQNIISNFLRVAIGAKDT